MSSEELQQQYDKILEAAAQAEQPKSPQEPAAEVKENKEEEGVENAATESKEEATESDAEGQSPSDDLDEELKNLDPELREILLKADADTRRAQSNAFKKMRANFDKKYTELGQEKKLAETGKQLFQKYGIDPNSGFSRVEKLINFETELEKDPRKVIKLLQAKFNLQDEKSGSDELDESLLTDEEKLLYKNQKNIEKKLESLEQENRGLRESKEREEINRIQEEIISFRDAKNDDGSLKNPYLEELLEDMSKLHSLYPKEGTEKLYNRALRLNDDVYNKSLEDAKLRERSRLNSEKDAAIKKAKSINSQSIKSSPQAPAARSLDDTLLAILESDPAYSSR